MVFELSEEDVLVIHAWTRRKHILNNGPETHRARQTDTRKDKTAQGDQTFGVQTSG